MKVSVVGFVKHVDSKQLKYESREGSLNKTRLNITRDEEITGSNILNRQKQ